MDKSNQESQEQGKPVLSRRRKLLTGSAAGAGVFLAMQAKTALGTTIKCQSPSAMISGNTSPRPDDGTTCSGGRSPGFWKQPQHFLYWAPSGLQYPTFYTAIVPCSQGVGNVSPCDIKTTGTRIGRLFPGAVGGNKGVWEVLMWHSSYPTIQGTPGTQGCQVSGNADAFGGQGELLRALASAYLNAGYFGSSSQAYPLTKQQVIDMWNAVKSGGLYCPTGMSCGNNGMDASQIISYITSMYDINSDVVNLCKNP